MIGRVSTGRSFKGAGNYYLHDKAKDGRHAATSERVAWTHTHNMMTDDPRAAFRVMAFTSMNAQNVKQQVGGSMAGRKSNGKDVFTFSLAWHPEQKPEREEIQSAAMSALEHLGLADHQAVFVAHNDTEHKHVHVIANLISQETGKKHTQSLSKKRLSEWSEKYERDHGKIYCEQRVANNERRRNGERVKYQEKPRLDKERVNAFYAQSKTGQEFADRMKAQGFRMASGDRRGFVIVDNEGKVHSVSRQLDKENRKTHKDKFKDLQDLQTVDAIREQQEKAREQMIEANKKTMENLRAEKKNEAERAGAPEKTRQLDKGQGLQKGFTKEATPEQDNTPESTREEQKEQVINYLRQQREKSRERERGGGGRERELWPDVGY